MNILTTLRKPYLAMLLSGLMLFISCEQGGLDTVYDTDDTTVSSEFGRSSTLEKSKERLAKINKEYDTKISFPDEFHTIVDQDPETIERTALANGWINQNDVFLMDEFINDLQESDFDKAISNFESNVDKLRLDKEELEEKRLVIEALKALNDSNPEVFAASTFGRGGWGCVRAVAALVISSVALASCATVIACGLAVSAWIISYASYVDNCRRN